MKGRWKTTDSLKQVSLKHHCSHDCGDEECVCVSACVSHPSQQAKKLLVGPLLSAAVQDHVAQLLLFIQTQHFH